jgi:ferredoxin-type protein NapH
LTGKIKLIMQIFFLIVFISIMILGKANLWMVIFLGGVLGSMLLGRFYCGWICPINTMMDGVDYIYKKRKVKRRTVPNWAKKPFVRYLSLAVFIGIIVLTLITGRKIPLLPMLVILGTIIALFYVPAFWHRYLCPYGALLSITGSLARFHWKVDESLCSKCEVCKKVCPAEAVFKENKQAFPKLEKSLCLECLACVKACPKNAISYGK